MVSILGCGWLGLPLAKTLVEKGYQVNGSVRNESKFSALQAAGVHPFNVRLELEISGDDLPRFFSASILIIDFPPERRDDIESYLLMQVKSLVQMIDTSNIEQVIFISSTSVYPDLNREVFEDENLAPEKGSGKALKLAEDYLLSQPGFTTTVIRFGGLVGNDRKPGRFLAGRKDVPGARSPINIIHQDDCIALICELLAQEAWGGIYNAATDEHPEKAIFYQRMAIQQGFERPEFSAEVSESYKIVNSDKIKNRLNFRFKFPDPMQMFD